MRHGLMKALLCAEPPPSTVGAPTKLHAARTLAEHQTQAIIRQCNAAIRWASGHMAVSACVCFAQLLQTTPIHTLAPAAQDAQGGQKADTACN